MASNLRRMALEYRRSLSHLAAPVLTSRLGAGQQTLLCALQARGSDSEQHFFFRISRSSPSSTDTWRNPLSPGITSDSGSGEVCPASPDKDNESRRTRGAIPPLLANTWTRCSSGEVSVVPMQQNPIPFAAILRGIKTSARSSSRASPVLAPLPDQVHSVQRMKPSRHYLGTRAYHYAAENSSSFSSSSSSTLSSSSLLVLRSSSSFKFSVSGKNAQLIKGHWEQTRGQHCSCPGLGGSPAKEIVVEYSENGETDFTDQFIALADGIEGVHSGVMVIGNPENTTPRDEAFEITANGQLLFSRLESKRLPQLEEVLDALAKLAPEVTEAQPSSS
eukprot:TRINITY_DN1918_c0_g2_i2.p1 TRINITY_DN1918_c0_g2~~TRINITY_DN1918_c0_g2_i2.p1  ORF type:complete len:351 (-),score=39.48 TRINITY_DN1918_c0_g2_i2:139-1137(-)